MAYNYKNISQILQELDLNKTPMVGPALCDTAEGDAEYDIPVNLNDYYIPFYKKYLETYGLKSKKFFCELQPNTEFVKFDGSLSSADKWTGYDIKEDGSVVCGLHLPLNTAYLGSLSEREINYTLENRKKVIDFGEKSGVKYYTVHISQDGFLFTEKNFVSVKNILRKTIEYFIQKRTNAYILIENLEYPKYPSTPQELFWWFNKVKEYAGNSGLKIGVVIDVAHLWKTRGDIMKNMREGKNLPEWIMEEKDIISQSYKDLLNYTLKTKLENIPVITFHLGGSYGYETHLIPGMRPDDAPDSAEIKINRFYDENIEMNLKSVIKTIAKYYFDSYRKVKELNKDSFRPLYIVTESFVSYKNNKRQFLKYPAVLKGIKAVHDYMLQYFEKLNAKSTNRVRFYNFLRK
ncbi:MAG: hypothetical protein BWY26_01646 [Elusimicrobia bacterium ADurb.Bin231]|nr:MAG: hypothetical protein BWY26_01646 [Elusimicrobia bacterium ADurb.Bin231]